MLWFWPPAVGYKPSTISQNSSSLLGTHNISHRSTYVVSTPRRQSKIKRLWLPLGVRKVDNNEVSEPRMPWFWHRGAVCSGRGWHDIFLSQNSSSFLLFFIIILLLLPIYLSRFVLHSQVGWHQDHIFSILRYLRYSILSSCLWLWHLL